MGPLRLSLGGVDGSWERVSRGKSSPSRSSGFLASCWNVVSSPPPIMTSERPRPPPPPLLTSSPVERVSEVQWAKLVVMTYKVPYVYEIVYVLFPVACIGLTFETCTKFTSRKRERGSEMGAGEMYCTLYKHCYVVLLEVQKKCQPTKKCTASIDIIHSEVLNLQYLYSTHLPLKAVGESSLSSLVPTTPSPATLPPEDR